MYDDDPPQHDKITPYWRWGMGIVGTMVLGICTYAADTLRGIEKEITKIETGYAIEIPALKEETKDLRKSIDELWRQLYRQDQRK